MGYNRTEGRDRKEANYDHFISIVSNIGSHHSNHSNITYGWLGGMADTCITSSWCNYRLHLLEAAFREEGEKEN